MTSRLWLVRHGETEGQSSVRFHGRNDVALDDTGRRQIRALAPWLEGVDFARMLRSPQRRAAESAAILAEAAGLDPGRFEVDERLREISFGECEGMTAEEIEAAYPVFWRSHRAGEAEAFPGGESRIAYAERVGAVARELRSGGGHGDLLVVGHRGTVRRFVRVFLDWPEERPDPFRVELGSLTVLRQPDPGSDRWEVELLGAVP